jgi:CubicO group peptidase (beta-lactamase class C family)
MLDAVERQDIRLRSLLIVRNGYLVTEAYFDPFTADVRQQIASVTKSVIGLLVGMAIDKGELKEPGQALLDFYPDRLAGAGADKQSIALKHLLSMTSGLDCSDAPRPGRPPMEQSPDWVAYMLDLPMASAPGSQFNYCSGSVHLLSAILEQASGLNARSFANQRLFAPLGIPDASPTDWGTDPQGVTLGGYGLSLTPRELAKLGFLFLHGGRWDGQQIVPADWVAQSTRQQTTKEDGTGYGYLWTVYPAEGRYAALGRGGQHIHVVPGLNLVVVTTAALDSFAEAPEINQLLTEYILPSVKSASPLDDNPQGLARLQAALQAAANPGQPLAPLPEMARAVSGHTYWLDDNPLGLQMMWVSFPEGEPVAQITLNGTQRSVIGLDKRYRLNSSGATTLALRGVWEDERTFMVEQITFGDVGQYQIRVTFRGDEVDLVYHDAVFGTTLAELHGRR